MTTTSVESVTTHKQSPSLDIEVAPWLCDLHSVLPLYRYFIIYGGRGSGKSEGIAQLMIYLALTEPHIKILCARHIQHSIAESSKDRIETWIRRMSLERHFHITRMDIINKDNGSRFLFKGLSNVTKDNITSINDIKYLWIEEAHTITQEVWERTYPSIRAPGSRIFITFNPHYGDDVLYNRFVTNSRDNAYTRRVNYTDNPWFVSTPLEAERAQDERLLPTPLYRHIWEGALRDFNDMPVIFTQRFLRYSQVPSLDSIIMSVDTAYTTQESSDFTALGCFGRVGNNYYLLHLETGKWEFDNLYTQLLSFYNACQRFGTITRILIEYKASGISLTQALKRRTQLPLHEVTVYKDKFTRVCDVLDILHSSFYIPNDAPWLASYLKELSDFTSNRQHKHDDQVDITTQALYYLRQAVDSQEHYRAYTMQVESTV